MPRPSNESLRKIFHVNESDQTMCFNGKCKGKVLNKHCGNLKRHLKSQHFDMYNLYMQMRVKSTSIKIDTTIRRCQHKSGGGKKKCSKNNCSKKANVKVVAKSSEPSSKAIQKKNLQLAVVELFTKSGLPFDLLRTRAFKLIAKPAFHRMQLGMSEEVVINEIESFAQQMKAEIRSELSGKLLSLKVDAATRRGNSVFGIHVHYVNESVLVVKTLAVKNLKPSDGVSAVQKIITEVLSDYSITMDQILTVAVDNVLIKNTDEEYEKDDTDFGESFDKIKIMFTAHGVTSIQKGSKILDLCVQDVMRSPDIRRKLERCRCMSHKLRTENNVNMHAIIDHPADWRSTYKMMDRLREIKDTVDPIGLNVKKNDLIAPNDEIWKFVDLFLTTFKPVFNAAAKLQADNVYLSDIYVVLMDIEFKINYLPDSDMKSLLKVALEKRKFRFLGNDLLLASVFLDPRVKICLRLDQVINAKEHIKLLHRRINALKDGVDCISIAESFEEIMSDDGSLPGRDVSHVTHDSFAAFLESLESTTNKGPLLENELSIYAQTPRYSLNSDLLDIWNSQNNALSLVAKTILAIPSAQATVERLFSCLDYIIGSMSSNLNTSNLENILIVKLNSVMKYED